MVCRRRPRQRRILFLKGHRTSAAQSRILEMTWSRRHLYLTSSSWIRLGRTSPRGERPEDIPRYTGSRRPGCSSSRFLSAGTLQTVASSPSGSLTSLA
ncbi:hypothetical protein CGCSCA1_v005877 [Colletotrichum siamense]|nr:hypothetical protein CGCSCA1_v005877 [Colletotrichum siamense]